jgi:hypothetical protein
LRTGHEPSSLIVPPDFASFEIGGPNGHLFCFLAR